METCRKFVEVLASDAPAPGGGGAKTVTNSRQFASVMSIKCNLLEDKFVGRGHDPTY